LVFTVSKIEKRIQITERHKKINYFFIEKDSEDFNKFDLLFYMKPLETIKHSELADSILENIAALVLVCDQTGAIIYCSQSILNLLQVESSEILGMGWWTLTRSDVEARNKEIDSLKKIIKGELPLDKTPYVNTIQDTTGKKYWIQWQDSFGPNKTLIGVGQNITEQHKAQQIIHEQSIQLKRLSLVAEKTNNVILILDKNGNIEWVSSSFERLNKITLAEMIASKGSNILTISGNRNIAEIFHKVINEKISCSYESKNEWVKDEIIWALSTISPVLDEKGELVNMIVIDSNITEMKKLENALENKTKDISDSINYAKRIQLAMLPDRKFLRTELSDSFILFWPKDIVSGDFYSLFQSGKKIIISAADCTGHGIPGAFMSILAGNILYQLIIENNKTNPSEILRLLNKSIYEILKQNQNGSRDGLDIALCAIDKENGMLEYSGANRPLWLIRNNELLEYSPDKNSIGGYQKDELRNYTTKKIETKKGDSFYIFSDGYADQFGGEKGKKIMTRTFKELLLSICHKPMIEQKDELQSFFKNWAGSIEQTDDVLVVGFKI
jgi:PAS domain S-box-containing protein